MRNKEFPHYEDWLLLFRRDRATGEGAEAMSESAANMMAEEATNLDFDATGFSFSQDFDATNLEIGDGSQCPQPTSQPTETSRGGKKRGRANEGVMKSLADIATSFSSFVSETGTRMDKIADTMHVARDIRAARMSLDDELQKLPLEDDDRLSLLMEIGESDRTLDIFLGLKDEVSRMRFVHRILTRLQS